MSCRFCAHWFTNGSTYDAEEGECRRFPRKEITTATYWCGEFFVEQERYVREGSLMNHFYLQMHDGFDNYKIEKKRRIQAEKKYKEFRAKQREIKKAVDQNG